MSNKPKVLATTEGGTGLTTTTAHRLLCSTGTNVMGEITNGTTGQLLQATAGTPNFATVSTGGLGIVYDFVSSASIGLAASSTYFWSLLSGWNAGQFAQSRLYIPVACTIKACYGQFSNSGASAGNCTLSLRLNNVTDNTITSTLSLATSTGTYNNTGLSISVSAGDYVELKIVTPAWTTPPGAGCVFSTSIYME